MLPYIGPYYLNNIGPGWHGLVRYVYDVAKKHCTDIAFTQVKEKFGTLRIYYTLPDAETEGFEEVMSLIQEAADTAESASGYICEDCGAPGTTHRIRDSSWLATLCDKCEDRLIKTKEDSGI